MSKITASDAQASDYFGIFVAISGVRTEHRAIAATQHAEIAGPDNHLPVKYALQPNYPNPFNPVTTIAFEVPDRDGKRAPVRISVYNVLGHKVRTLVNTSYAPGTYRVSWDSRDQNGINVSSGVYLYILTADKISIARKMTLMRWQPESVGIANCDCLRNILWTQKKISTRVGF